MSFLFDHVYHVGERDVETEFFVSWTSRRSYCYLF